MSKTRPFVVSRPGQLAALASPARQEIVDVLARMGTASVAELAATLGRPADGLYYHVRALQRAGLVVAAASQAGEGRRGQARFRTVAPEIALRYAPGPGAGTRPVRAIVSSMLRLGIRDFSRAYGGDRVVLDGPGRELWALRATGWLTAAGVAAVNRRIQGLRDSVARPNRGGRLYAITILLTPLDHRARKPQRRPRAPMRAKP